MSVQRAGEFLARASSDPSLRPLLLSVRSGEDLLAVARREGFVFELADLGGCLVEYRVDRSPGVIDGEFLSKSRTLVRAAGVPVHGDDPIRSNASPPIAGTRLLSGRPDP